MFSLQTYGERNAATIPDAIHVEISPEFRQFKSRASHKDPVIRYQGEDMPLSPDSSEGPRATSVQLADTLVGRRSFEMGDTLPTATRLLPTPRQRRARILAFSVLIASASLLLSALLLVASTAASPSQALQGISSAQPEATRPQAVQPLEPVATPVDAVSSPSSDAPTMSAQPTHGKPAYRQKRRSR
jgi:hypothetical protein